MKMPADMTSIWDLAQLVIGLISCGVVGLFFLGLFTKRANELGANMTSPQPLV
ncbi:hypothetical protein [Coraliomargarita parva]|uniref:hypothetical protein n=1 Tax=Coraliomargarita parva TaxID=3014050 RepID=UPI0022B42780|nr:hypothetical protein [Coraliomargarita parva]